MSFTHDWSSHYTILILWKEFQGSFTEECKRTKEYLLSFVFTLDKRENNRKWRQKISSFLYSFVRSSLVWFINYNQKDANILGYLFLKCCTYFRRFLRPSSGAHNCTFSFRYCQPILLQPGIVDETDTSLQQDWFTIPEAERTVMCSWWWAEEQPETCRAF